MEIKREGVRAAAAAERRLSVPALLHPAYATGCIESNMQLAAQCEAAEVALVQQQHRAAAAQTKLL